MSSPSSALLVSVSRLAKRFGDRQVLQDIDLELRAGEILTLIGPNGSGKTTLARLVLGLLQPSAGKVWRAPSLKVGYTPQRLQVDEILPLTVRHFLLLGGRCPASRLLDVSAEVGIASLLERPIQAISAGELQRVLLTRALLRKPDLLVLDEPAQGVDVNGQEELYGLIARIRDHYGCAVLLVSHDLYLVMAAADRIICLNRHICCSGAPEAVSRDPAYLDLFGARGGRLGVYTHHHNHAHDLHGDVIAGSAARHPASE
jgi:zinc transport system ATP-binding protein